MSNLASAPDVQIVPLFMPLALNETLSMLSISPLDTDYYPTSLHLLSS